MRFVGPTRETWGTFAAAGATGWWKSHPLTPGNFGWLKFETAGALAQPGSGVSLSLLDAQTGATLAAVAPTKSPGDTWRAAYVRMPAVPFVVAASDTAAAPWLAFSPPVEMGAGSYWAWQAVKNGALLFWFALGATLLCTLGLWWTGRAPRERL